jgi:hypothetical protein
MSVRVEPISLKDIEYQLQQYEEWSGMSTADFVASYSDGRLPQDDEPYLSWFMTYDAWRLASEARDRRH